MTEETDLVDQLWAMADLVTPMAIRVAATLRIADHLASGAKTAADLADAAHADADALDRLLRHLVHVGVLAAAEAGGYVLTALGEPLRNDHPDRLRGLLDLEGAIGRADLSFVRLLHSVRTGEPAFPEQFGLGFWDDLASDSTRSASYAAQMGADVAAWATDIVPAYDWGSLGHVVDVGGGDGTLLIALLRAYPSLRGTVLDLPGPIGIARTALASAGLADRATAVAGSFFDPLPPGAGGYVLSAITHNWPDDAATVILRRCAEAAGQDGTVFVIEKTGPDGESPSTSMDLRVLAYFAGRERGVADLTELAAGAGLRTVAAHAAGTLSILECSSPTR